MKYAGVGLVNAAVTIAIMVVLERIGFGYLIYTAIGYFAGFVNSYTLNGLFTFRAGSLSLRHFGQFCALNLALLVCVEVIEFALIDGAGIHEFLGVAIGMVTYTAVGFVLNRALIFRRQIA
jgi:putative flippase GtrA